MGWWSVPEEDNITIGDTILDLTRRFLIDFSQEYQEDLGRKPNLTEFKYALNLAFKVNINESILQDFEELEIKNIEIKTSKIPKRVKPKPGDIFAFKINDELFGFGRLVSKVDIGMVAEIFDYFSSQPILDMSKLEKWLIQPLVLDSYSLFELRLEGDWRIIGHSELKNVNERFNNIRFIYGEPPNHLKAVSIDDTETSITQEDAVGLRYYSPCGDEKVKKLIFEVINKS